MVHNSTEAGTSMHNSWTFLFSIYPVCTRDGLTNVAADKHFSDAASPQW